MKKINIFDEIDIEKEKIKFLKNCNDHARRHLEYAFNEFKFWYKIKIKQVGFESLIIGESPLGRKIVNLPDAVNEIYNNKILLGQERLGAGFDLKQVNKYYKKFKIDKKAELNDIFVVQKHFYSDEDLYVIDGMHRLVAYGLLIKEGEQPFVNFHANLGWEKEIIWRRLGKFYLKN